MPQGADAKIGNIRRGKSPCAIPGGVYSEFMGSGKSGRVVGAVLAATFVLVICGAGVEAGAQTRKRAPQKKATAAVWTRTDCGGDVAVFLSAPGATQGGLLQTELRRRFSGTPIIVASIAADWGASYLPPSQLYGRGVYQESIAVVAAGSLEQLIESVATRIAATRESS